MRKNFVLWGVAVVGATSIVNCSIQDLPADSADGGAGAAAGKSGSAAQSGGAGVTGGGPGEGGTNGGDAGEGGAAGNEPTSNAGHSSGGASGVGGSGGIGTGGSAAGGPATGGSSGAATGGGGTGGVGGAGGVSGTGGVPACLDVQTSDANCGACGYACVNGRHCSAGRCAPAWQPLATENQPEPRTSHAAGYVDGEYVVFGGSSATDGVASGVTATYDVVANKWGNAPPLNFARCGHSAVSTGSSIITFGGLTSCTNGTSTGPGFEIFAGRNWTSVPGGPNGRYDLNSVWTGKEMFIYGGSTNVTPALATGSRFDPSGPKWTDVTCSLANCERAGSALFVDGGVVRLWGGGYGDAPAGLQYDLTSGAWSSWSVPVDTASHLSGRYADDGRRIYFVNGTNQVSIFDRRTLKWLASDTSPTPAGFCGAAPPAWTGTELVAWSGSCGGAPVAVGGRYQPAAPN